MWKQSLVNLIPEINFHFQEEDLDSQQGVIDFSLYLRSNKVRKELLINYAKQIGEGEGCSWQ